MRYNFETKAAKEYVDKVGSEKGEPLIVPNENFKKMFNKIIK